MIVVLWNCFTNQIAISSLFTPSSGLLQQQQQQEQEQQQQQQQQPPAGQLASQ